MPRNKHFKNRGRGGNVGKRHKPSQSSTVQTAVTNKEERFNISSKRSKVTYEQEASSDSGGESDPFTSLLSSFSVQKTESVFETDESDSSDDENEIVTETILDVSESSDEDDDDHNIIDEDHDSVGEDVNDLNEVDDEINIEVDVATDDVSAKDPFVKHLNYDLDENLLEVIQSIQPTYKVLQEHWPILGPLKFNLPDVKKQSQKKLPKVIVEDDTVFAPYGSVPSRIISVDLAELYVKSQIHGNIVSANRENLKDEAEILFTALQKEIFTILNNYQDLYFPSRTLENGEEIRFMYVLHSLNHVLKARTKIIHHNTKIQNSKRNDVPDEYRDQGLVRPKVLILVPFKDSAFRIIKMIMNLLYPNDKGHVIKKARFLEEFTGNELTFPFKNPLPEDYEKTFCGNTDDNFKIGLSITRKSLKLYVDFYSADIIVASPVGLRVIIGADGEAQRDYDFLASIEILILDQAEIFLMQNWDHILHVMNHLHLQPKQSHGTDFARVRSWAINGWSRFYRQTLLFSSISVPEINSLFNKKCNNFAGKVRVERQHEKGSVCQVILQLSQVFHKFSSSGGQSAVDARFNFFTKKIIPQFTDTTMSHVLIYVPSYFDYVRIRNYFKREDMSFVQICEYSKDSKIARARDLFYHNEANILLYSERAHFFRRFKIKGVRHIIFYQPPTIPNFYSELCNCMAENNQIRGLDASNKSVTVLYAKSDGLQLAAIVGTEKAARMLSSDRDVHMFVSGE